MTTVKGDSPFNTYERHDFSRGDVQYIFRLRDGAPWPRMGLLVQKDRDPEFDPRETPPVEVVEWIATQHYGVHVFTSRAHDDARALLDYLRTHETADALASRSARIAAIGREIVALGNESRLIDAERARIDPNGPDIYGEDQIGAETIKDILADRSLKRISLVGRVLRYSYDAAGGEWYEDLVMDPAEAATLVDAWRASRKF